MKLKNLNFILNAKQSLKNYKLKSYNIRLLFYKDYCVNNLENGYKAGEGYSKTLLYIYHIFIFTSYSNSHNYLIR